MQNIQLLIRDFKNVVKIQGSVPRASDSYNAISGGSFFIEPIQPVVFLTQQFILPTTVNGNYSIENNIKCNYPKNSLITIDTTTDNGSEPCKNICTNNKNCVGFTFEGNSCILHSTRSGCC